MKKKKIVRAQIYIDSLRIYYKFIMKKKINSYINLFFLLRNNLHLQIIIF